MIMYMIMHMKWVSTENTLKELNTVVRYSMNSFKKCMPDLFIKSTANFGFNFIWKLPVVFENAWGLTITICNT